MTKKLPAAFEAVLHAQCGVFAYEQAIAAGVTDDFVCWQDSSGRWQRPFPHVYAAHSGPLSPAQLRWAAWAYCYPHGVLSCHTAAELHGLRGYSAPDIHVTVPVNHQPRRRPGLRIHQSRRIDPDVQPLKSPARMRIERSLIDMAAHARQTDDAVAILAAGVQQRLTSGAKIQATLSAMPSVNRRALMLTACADLSGGSHSLIELAAAALFRRYALPPPDRQVALTLPDRLARVDCYWEEFGVVMELDGRMHMDAEQWTADLDRQNELGLSQRLVLRYPLWTLRLAPDRVADQLRRAFARSPGGVLTLGAS